MALYYTTATDILRVCPAYLQTQLLDDDHDGAEEAGLADLLLEEAESLVDSYLSARYSVPLVDNQLRTAKRLTLGAFLYYAHQRLNSVDDRIEKAFEIVLSELERIADGKNERAQEHTERPAAVSTIGSSPRVFSRDSLKGL